MMCISLGNSYPYLSYQTYFFTDLELSSGFLFPAEHSFKPHNFVGLLSSENPLEAKQLQPRFLSDNCKTQSRTLRWRHFSSMWLCVLCVWVCLCLALHVCAFGPKDKDSCRPACLRLFVCLFDSICLFVCLPVAFYLLPFYGQPFFLSPNVAELIDHQSYRPIHLLAYLPSDVL